MLSRRSFTALAAAAGLAGTAGRRARAADPRIKIGVITDMTGPLSSVLGTARRRRRTRSTTAARCNT